MLSIVGKRRYEQIEKSYIIGDLTDKGYVVKRKQLFIKESLRIEDSNNQGIYVIFDV